MSIRQFVLRYMYKEVSFIIFTANLIGFYGSSTKIRTFQKECTFKISDIQQYIHDASFRSNYQNWGALAFVS